MQKLTVTATQLEQTMLAQPVKLLRALMKNPLNPDEGNAVEGLLPDSADFDLDGAGSDHNSGLPHSMPDASVLSAYLGRLGISEDTAVVVYDDKGIYCAPRVWWMLKAMGHEQVTILDGGAPAWRAAGLPVDVEQPGLSLRQYSAQPQSGWFVNSSAVLAAQNTGAQIVDARSPERFKGTAEEPRAGVRRGHIPGSVNLYYQSLLDSGQFLKETQLRSAFAQAGIDLNKPIICTCGSGVTACIIGVAAKMLGASEVSVYDGSWSEWGADTQYPVATA
ncbi:sulfurtransferase [Alteromonas halophila]|uniref:Sulfurtransferase n=1 Tax=Alteromonas halophila TaxID=516698 RepID=A0A918JM13_9ALTE|nr:sulfurtransferase [Alteromonas halophila]GGW88736.1 sulfurtransferase [Alteromonas halophila]